MVYKKIYEIGYNFTFTNQLCSCLIDTAHDEKEKPIFTLKIKAIPNSYLDYAYKKFDGLFVSDKLRQPIDKYKPIIQLLDIISAIEKNTYIIDEKPYYNETDIIELKNYIIKYGFFFPVNENNYTIVPVNELVVLLKHFKNTFTVLSNILSLAPNYKDLFNALSEILFINYTNLFSSESLKPYSPKTHVLAYSWNNKEYEKEHNVVKRETYCIEIDSYDEDPAQIGGAYVDYDEIDVEVYDYNKHSLLYKHEPDTKYESSYYKVFDTVNNAFFKFSATDYGYYREPLNIDNNLIYDYSNRNEIDSKKYSETEYSMLLNKIESYSCFFKKLDNSYTFNNNIVDVARLGHNIYGNLTATKGRYTDPFKMVDFFYRSEIPITQVMDCHLDIYYRYANMLCKEQASKFFIDFLFHLSNNFNISNITNLGQVSISKNHFKEFLNFQDNVSEIDFFETDENINSNMKKNTNDEIWSDVSIELKKHLIETAKLTFKEILDKELKNISPVTDIETLKAEWHIPNYFAALYYSIFYHMQNKEIIKECANYSCYHSFVVSTTNTRNIYCSPVCSGVMAQRKHREKLKNKK